MSLPVLPAPKRRRGRPRRRASSIVSRVRLAAALVLLVTAAGLHSLTTSPVFALDPATVSIEGLHYTDGGAARSAMAIPEDVNVFRLRTGDIERSLRALPAIRGATVQVLLPDTVSVAVEERAAILAWRDGETVLLADAEGVLFARPTESEALPTIDDRRTTSVPMAIGDTLDALDLEVARVLGAVRPADIDSTATALAVSIEDVDGWVIEADTGWRAVFGQYTVALRPPTSIGAQVACLRGLLADQEERIETVTLSLSTDACGTYRERSEPSPSAAPTDERGDRPTRRP